MLPAADDPQAEHPLLIERATVSGVRCDVLIRAGRVERLEPRIGIGPDVVRLDAAGGALIPGLHDHHAHLLAFAAARQSVQTGPPTVRNAVELVNALKRGDQSLPPGRWIRGVGYHESVAGMLDRVLLDAAVPDRPVRVMHRSGALWILNSCALAEARIDGPIVPGVECDDTDVPTGRLYRLDTWLRARVPLQPPDLRAAAAELNGYGITGVTDATPFAAASDIEPLLAAVRSGLPLRLTLMGAPGLPQPREGLLARGPRKIVVRDDDLPTPGDLAELIRRARAERRPVAVHAVTLEGLVLAVAAWDEAGVWPGDRLEHGAIVPPAQARRLAQMRITVVTQPNFVYERGDEYLADVDPRDIPYLYPCRQLLRVGIRVGFGSDAPFGSADPWVAIRAAANRRTRSGRALGLRERIPGGAALARFISRPQAPGGPPRRVTPGMAADLCLLRVSLEETLAAPSSDAVAATIRAGRIVALR